MPLLPTVGVARSAIGPLPLAPRTATKRKRARCSRARLRTFLCGTPPGHRSVLEAAATIEERKPGRGDASETIRKPGICSGVGL